MPVRSGTCPPLHTQRVVAICLLNQHIKFLPSSEPLQWPEMLFLQSLTWLALAHHSGISLKLPYQREIFWPYRIKNCPFPLCIRRPLCFIVLRQWGTIWGLILYVFSYICILVISAPLEHQLHGRREIVLFSVASQVQPWHNIRA